MYLSRVKLDTKKTNTMRALASPQIMHATIENCFSQKNRTLWRLDSLNGSLYLLVVSEATPNFNDLTAQLCESEAAGQTKNYAAFLSAIQNGQKLRFRFRGNPVHSVVINKGERGKVTPHISEQHKRAWLVKKAAANGFALEEDSFVMVDTGQHRFTREGQKNAVRLSYATFEGVLTVTDAAAFVSALAQGIGRGKAYGCGLMTVMVM